MNIADAPPFPTVAPHAAHGPNERLVVLHFREEIAARIGTLARCIREDYRGRDLAVLGVLTGGFVFVADLVRALDRPLTVDFVGLSSYGAGRTSSGRVVMTKPPTTTITGRDVLVVEDLLDTGRSMRFLLDTLRALKPRSLRLCVLVDKRARRTTSVEAHYVGFTIDDGFVVGYGIDGGGRHRWIPDLCRLEEVPG